MDIEEKLIVEALRRDEKLEKNGLTFVFIEQTVDGSNIIKMGFLPGLNNRLRYELYAEKTLVGKGEVHNGISSMPIDFGNVKTEKPEVRIKFYASPLKKRILRRWEYIGEAVFEIINMNESAESSTKQDEEAAPHDESTSDDSFSMETHDSEAMDEQEGSEPSLLVDATEDDETDDHEDAALVDRGTEALQTAEAGENDDSERSQDPETEPGEAEPAADIHAFPFDIPKFTSKKVVPFSRKSSSHQLTIGDCQDPISLDEFEDKSDRPTGYGTNEQEGSGHECDDVEDDDLIAIDDKDFDEETTDEPLESTMPKEWSSIRESRFDRNEESPEKPDPVEMEESMTGIKNDIRKLADVIDIHELRIADMEKKTAAGSKWEKVFDSIHELVQRMNELDAKMEMVLKKISGPEEYPEESMD